jgi:hypothetical protein
VSGHDRSPSALLDCVCVALWRSRSVGQGRAAAKRTLDAPSVSLTLKDGRMPALLGIRPSKQKRLAPDQSTRSSTESSLALSSFLTASVSSLQLAAMESRQTPIEFKWNAYRCGLHPGGSATPEERWYHAVSKGRVHSEWLPRLRRQSLSGSRHRRFGFDRSGGEAAVSIHTAGLWLPSPSRAHRASGRVSRNSASH